MTAAQQIKHLFISQFYQEGGSVAPNLYFGDDKFEARLLDGDEMFVATLLEDEGKSTVRGRD